MGGFFEYSVAPHRELGLPRGRAWPHLRGPYHRRQPWAQKACPAQLRELERNNGYSMHILA